MMASEALSGSWGWTAAKFPNAIHIPQLSSAEQARKAPQTERVPPCSSSSAIHRTLCAEIQATLRSCHPSVATLPKGLRLEYRFTSAARLGTFILIFDGLLFLQFLDVIGQSILVQTFCLLRNAPGKWKQRCVICLQHTPSLGFPKDYLLESGKRPRTWKLGLNYVSCC